MAVKITQRTREVIAHLFDSAKVPLIEQLLIDECGSNLPLYKPSTPEGLERILREVISNSAVYRALVEPAFRTVKRADIELYIAVIARSIELARRDYGVPTLILYLPFVPTYLSQTGYTDAEIMQKLREAGAYVIDGTINTADHPGTVLYIPGDGHPTGATNRLRAEMLKEWFDRNAASLLTSEATAR